MKWMTRQFIPNSVREDAATVSDKWPSSIAITESTLKAQREKITLIGGPVIRWHELDELTAATIRDRYPDAAAGDWLVDVLWETEEP